MMQLKLAKLNWILLSIACATLSTCVGPQSGNESQLLDKEAPLLQGVESTLLPGRYVGYIRLDTPTSKVPVIFDIVAQASRKEHLAYSGVISARLGSFDSDEGFSQFYPRMIVKKGSKKMNVLSGRDQWGLSDVRIEKSRAISGQIRTPAGTAVGKMFVVYAGRRTELNIAKLLNVLYAKDKIFRPRQGKFVAACKNRKPAAMTIWAELNANEKTIPRHLLDRMTYKAALQTYDKDLCVSSSGSCTTEVFEDVRMDLAKAKILFRGSSKTRSCSLTADGFDCGECQYQSGSDDLLSADRLQASLSRLLAAGAQPNQTQLNLGAERVFSGAVAHASQIAGNYLGFLHAERNNEYQALALRLDADPKLTSTDRGASASVLNVSGQMHLYLGDPSIREFAGFEFLKQDFRPVSPTAVLQSRGAAFIQISTWNERGIRGILYSKLHGRIGSFELMRGDDFPALASGLVRLPALSGAYAGSKGTMHLVAQGGFSKHNRDVAPLYMKGVLRSHDKQSSFSILNRVAYDVFAQRLNLSTPDGEMAQGRFVNLSFELAWSGKIGVAQASENARSEVLTLMGDSVRGLNASALSYLLSR